MGNPSLADSSCAWSSAPVLADRNAGLDALLAMRAMRRSFPVTAGEGASPEAWVPEGGGLSPVEAGGVRRQEDSPRAAVSMAARRRLRAMLVPGSRDAARSGRSPAAIPPPCAHASEHPHEHPHQHEKEPDPAPEHEHAPPPARAPLAPAPRSSLPQLFGAARLT